MANTKISNLPGAASVTDASVLPVVDSGTTKKVTGLQIKNYARSGLSTVASSGSYSDLTNKPTIPSITGLATEAYVNSAVGAITIPTVPTNLSQLTNDAGFITSWGQADWNEQINESPTYIQNKPTIPTDISQLTDNNSLLGQGGGTGTGNLIITDTTITSNTNDIVIGAAQTASPAPGFYTFASDGTFKFPNYVTQNTNQNVSCPANQDTIIYVGTTQWQHTFKLLLKIEGVEDGQSQWDTQSCEMMVAKSFRNNLVAGSVYGLVYTSQSPLATFTTRWNATSNRVEVLCRPASLTYGVEVRSFVTEITTSD